jgi:hypothetical protein
MRKTISLHKRMIAASSLLALHEILFKHKILSAHLCRWRHPLKWLLPRALAAIAEWCSTLCVVTWTTPRCGTRSQCSSWEAGWQVGTTFSYTCKHNKATHTCITICTSFRKLVDQCVQLFLHLQTKHLYGNITLLILQSQLTGGYDYFLRLHTQRQQASLQ